MMVYSANLQLKPIESFPAISQPRTDSSIITTPLVSTDPTDNSKRTTKRGLDYSLPSFVDDSAYTFAKLASAADPWLGA